MTTLYLPRLEPTMHYVPALLISTRVHDELQGDFPKRVRNCRNNAPFKRGISPGASGAQMRFASVRALIELRLTHLPLRYLVVFFLCPDLRFGSFYQLQEQFHASRLNLVHTQRLPIGRFPDNSGVLQACSKCPDR